MFTILGVLIVGLLLSHGGWWWGYTRAQRRAIIARTEAQNALTLIVRDTTADRDTATARIQDLTRALQVCQQQTTAAAALQDALRERQADLAARQAVAEARLHAEATQALVDAAARETEIQQLRLDAARVDVRQVFIDLGLPGDQFADAFDLSTTGKLNELLHFVSARRDHSHPLRTVGDVVAYVATCAKETP